MTVSHVIALLGLLMAVVGTVAGATWVWATGLTIALVYFVVAEMSDEMFRGFLAAAGIPVVLTVAILAGS